MGVPVGYVAGTSIGAIMGGLYAAGRTEEAFRWAEESDWKKIPKLLFDPHFTKKGLLSGGAVERLLSEFIPVDDFTELAIPFAAVGTDLMTGEAVVMRSGGLHSAIRASMSIPGVFSPVEREGRILVDGGLVNPLPVNVCRALGAERVLAVDINDCGGMSLPAKPFAKINLLDVLLATSRIFNAEMTRHTLAVSAPDVLLSPPVSSTLILDFRNSNRLIDIGYRCAHERADEILALAE